MNSHGYNTARVLKCRAKYHQMYKFVEACFKHVICGALQDRWQTNKSTHMGKPLNDTTW